MRDYLLVFIMLGNLPIGVVKPFYGLLAYTWVSYMYPQMLTWSFGQRLPVAKLAAVSALLGTLLNRAGDPSPLRDRATIAMILLWCTFTISTIFAVYPDLAWNEYQDVSKLIVMALVASVLLTDRKRTRYFLLVIALSIGFYGVKGGIFSFRTSGEQMVWGPGTSIIAGNNAIGLALNMYLPIVWYLAHDSRGLVKRALQAIFFISIPAVMFTYSRASAITLAFVLLALILKGRSAVILLSVMVFGALIAVPAIPDKWWGRQQSTLTYEEDRSAMSRIDNWKFCWRVALDKPIAGAGFEFQTREMFAKYAPEFLETYGKAWNTHNIFLAMLATHGFPGLFLFLVMIGFSLGNCRRIRRRVRGRRDLDWLTTYCDLVEVSMLAFLLNGSFVNMEYFDLPYHLVALTASMTAIYNRLVAENPTVIPVTSDLAPASAT